MRLNKGKLRTSYESLTVVTTVEILTPLSSVRQVFDAETGSYEPDRELTPCVLYPRVQADSPDGSWNQKEINGLLAQMVWKANGTPVSEIDRFKGGYTITSTGEEKGKLAIMVNIPPSEIWELTFEAVVSDSRIGRNVPVRSDAIILSTADKSEDGWALSLDCEETIYYNPFLDKLLEYDYLTSNGVAAVYPSVEHSYKRTINTLVTKAAKEADAGEYELRLFGINESGSLVDASDYIEVTSVLKSRIELDLRVVEKAQYAAIVYVEGDEVARKLFSVERIYPAFASQLLRSAPMMASDMVIHNEISISHNNKVVENPEAYMEFVWVSTTAAIAEKKHNAGVKTAIRKKDAGVGVTSSDSWVEIAVDGGLKTASMVASEGVDFFVDEDDNLFIIE